VGHKHVPESELVQFRVSKELATGLSAAASEQELSRSEYLRRLVEQDLAGELVAVPDLDGEVDVASLSRKALLALDRRLTTNPDALPGTGLMNLVERNLRLEEEKQRDDGPRFKYLDDAYSMVREFEASVLASVLRARSWSQSGFPLALDQHKEELLMSFKMEYKIGNRKV
jgi:hypothetical protein